MGRKHGAAKSAAAKKRAKLGAEGKTASDPVKVTNSTSSYETSRVEAERAPAAVKTDADPLIWERVEWQSSSKPCWLDHVCLSFLDSSSAACLSLCSRLLCAETNTVACRQLATTLSGSCLLKDMTAKPQPLLALSHLEHLAHSELIFAAARDLLRWFAGDGGAWLLEVGAECELCEAISRHVFDGAAGAAALLSTLVHEFESQDAWGVRLLAALKKLAKRRKGKPSGEALELFLLGATQLLPVTRASGGDHGHSSELLCQLLERLVFPTVQAREVLYLELLNLKQDEVDSMAKLDQSEVFHRTSRELLAGWTAARPDDVHVWVIKAPSVHKHYVIVLEDVE